MLQVGAVHACDKSKLGHPEDLSSSDDSFCLQVKIQCTQSDCKIDSNTISLDPKPCI